MYKTIFQCFIWPMILLSFIATGRAGEKTCVSEIVIKNPSDEYKFGAIWSPPPFSDGTLPEVGVWFPVVPRSITVDSKDNIYIGDSVNSRVLKFDNSGKFISSFKLQPPQYKAKPYPSHMIQDLGTDKDDNIYVWNYWEGRIEIYDRFGGFIKSVVIKANEKNNVFAKSPRGKFSKYTYAVDSYIPDKKYPGRELYSITVKDASKVVARCSGVELEYDESGLIYNFDNYGNLLAFNYKTLAVIRINPFK